MQSIFQFLTTLFFLCIASVSFASTPAIITAQNLQKQSLDEQLHLDPTWLKLLHLNRGNTETSSIITPEFFLSTEDTENISPKNELNSTIAALLSPIEDGANTHAQCLFPARFFWLKKKLNLPDNAFPNIKCPAFSSWSDIESLESISLLMVSGYFGNPASTFGHALIKINHDKYQNSGNLLDQGVNFGATIPPKEPSIVYIAKGLFGGYVAGFSDKEFYNQDLIYSKTENRDMWEYSLNLSNYEKQLIVSHIWELKHAKYIYYFLKENCAFRVAELFELTNDEQWINKTQPWALPASLFHTIDDISNSKTKNPIKSISFIPSSQRQLYDRFNALSDNEKKAVNLIIDQPETLNTITAKHSPEVLNTALSYFQYKIAATKEEPNHNYLMARDQTLKARIKLPPATTKTKQEQTPPPISQGAKPGLASLGFGHLSGKTFTELNFAAIHYDPIGNFKGGLEQSELKVLAATLSDQNSNKLQLKKLDIVSVKKLETDRSGIIGEHSYAWQVSTGLKPSYENESNHLSFYARTAFGKSFRLTENLKYFAMIGAEYQSNENALFAIPLNGIIYSISNKAALSLDVESHINAATHKTTLATAFEMRISLSQQNEIRISVQNEDETTSTLTYQHHW